LVVTSKYRKATMFVIVDIKSIPYKLFIFMFYPRTKFHILKPSGSLFIVIRAKVKENIHTVDIILFHIKETLTEVIYFFHHLLLHGHAVAQLIEHYATSRKVPDLIPNKIIGFFN
jgi:hypothetical protein